MKALVLIFLPMTLAGCVRVSGSFDIVDNRAAVISRADLIYTEPARRSEEGMPVGNGRMGSLVWTTPDAIRLQVNRADVYANDSTTTSFFERHSDYCGGCG